MFKYICFYDIVSLHTIRQWAPPVNCVERISLMHAVTYVYVAWQNTQLYNKYVLMCYGVQ